MTNSEATITENAATAAEQGAHVAPERDSSKKGATPKKGAPKSQKATKGGKAKASPKKGAQGRHQGQARPRHGSQPAARREQGRKDPGTDRAAQGGEPGRDYESNFLAGPQRTRLPLDRRQEARPQDRVHQDRGRRSRIPDQKVEVSRLRPPPARVGGFFLRPQRS
jgi:hypothetical protein